MKTSPMQPDQTQREEETVEPNANLTVSNNTAPTRTAEEVRFAAPFVDVLENKEELVVYVDLPGVKRDDVSIRIDKDQLLIEARREANEKLGRPLMVEYRPLSLRRQFTIQQGSVEVEKISADLQNGVLKLALPKAARVKPRVIPITTG